MKDGVMRLKEGQSRLERNLDLLLESQVGREAQFMPGEVYSKLHLLCRLSMASPRIDKVLEAMSEGKLIHPLL